MPLRAPLPPLRFAVVATREREDERPTDGNPPPRRPSAARLPVLCNFDAVAPAAAAAVVAATLAVAELAAGVRAAVTVDDGEEEDAGEAAHITARTSARTLTQQKIE